MLKKNPRQNIEETCLSLREVKEYLSDAANVVENNETKEKLENQVETIKSCLNQCQDIADILRKH